MSLSSKLWPQIAVCVYAFYSCSVVLTGTYGPADPYGHLATWLWLVPLLLARRDLGQGPMVLSAVAVVLVLLGRLAQFSSIKYLGLACSVVALVPWTHFSILWLGLAISWVPAFVLPLNWIGMVAFVSPLRFALAALAPLLALGHNRLRGARA